MWRAWHINCSHTIDTHSNHRFFASSEKAIYEVASMATTARHVIDTHLNPRSLS